MGVGGTVAADGLHGLDEEAEAAHRRHVQRQRGRREGQRHQQLQHLVDSSWTNACSLLVLPPWFPSPPATRANPIR